MEPIRDIVQKEIDMVIDNAPDKAGNKIKLRRASHENLVRHLKSVPYNMVSVVSNVNDNSNEKNWNLNSIDSVGILNGARKPINVKQNMIDNIRRHGGITSINEDVVTVDIETQIPEQQGVGNVEEANIGMSSVNNFAASVVTDSVNFDNDEAYSDEETANIRQQLLRKKEIFTQAKKNADEINKAIQESEMQYTELEKQLQEARLRNKEAHLKSLEIRRSQHETMKKNDKRFDILIDEINKENEKSMNILAERNLKISSAQDEIANLNNETARIEEEINATLSNNIIDFPYVDDMQEENIKKIA